jgi:hypothetical protein
LVLSPVSKRRAAVIANGLLGSDRSRA